MPVGRPAITARKDDDGGVTVHDTATGIVVSIIGVDPHSDDPRLIVEAYSYVSGRRVTLTEIPENMKRNTNPVILLRSEPRA